MSSRSVRGLRRPIGVTGLMGGPLGLSARFVVTVVALHAPSWLLAAVFQGPRADERPWFNLDLLLAGVLACLSPIVGGVALLVAWAADAIRLASKNYHFMSVMDFMDAARFVDMLNVSIFVTPSPVALVAVLAVCAWIVLRQSRVRRLWLPLVGFMVLCIGLDALNGSLHLFGMEKDSRLLHTNFAGSPSWNVWRAQRQAAVVAGAPAPMVPAVAHDALRAWHEAQPRGSSLLVLVESMGLPRDPGLREWLAERIDTRRMSQRWRVTAAREPFSGATTSGELRTLCGLQAHYSRLDAQAASRCLPRQLAAKGVRSIGLHGFGLRMFDRRDWWPRIGLLPWQWPEDPAAAGLPMNCNHAFPGICDRAVLSRAIEEAQEPSRLVYALTLDTHLPLAAPLEPMPPELKAACARAAAPASACQLMQRLGQVLDDLEQRLAASLTTPFVVIAGDHAPPFGEKDNREVFESDEVPVILMKPENAADRGRER
ncbi:hypothetical protein [Roseateles sp. BYS96W]|uniref:Sulfatase N-terminal domain-containing protein n=1 Tax=Pelomonas nitida TaxID=3299027 RepID=A0ABW7G4T3_9BURK